MQSAHRTGRNRLLLLLSGVVVLVLLLAIHFSKSRENEVQKYLDHLRAQGEKVTFADLNRGSPPGSGLAHNFILTNLQRLPSYELDPKSAFKEPYLSLGGAGVTWRQPLPPLNSASGKALTWDEFNAILLRTQGPLGEIREFLKTANLDGIAGTTAMNTVSGNIFDLINCARWFSIALQGELHSGRPAEALEDIAALGALANVNRSPNSLIGSIGRLAVSDIALSATWQALQYQGWSEAQLERTQRTWEPLDQVPFTEAAIAAHRIEGIELWDQCRTSTVSPLANVGAPTPRTWQALAKDWTDAVGYRLYRTTSINQDELLYLEAHQQALAAVRAIKTGRPQVLHAFKTNALNQQLIQRSGQSQYRHYLSKMMMPRFTGMIQNTAQNETIRQMTLATIAIRRYQLRHGAPPADLAVLCPEFLAQPTYDPMSGKGLRYRPGTNGDWLLYSTGEDGVDDGGDPTPKPGEPAGFWAGRDAVWPRPDK